MEMATQRAESGTTPSLPSRRPGISAELATNLLDHLLSRPADGVDGERGEQERKTGTEEKADEHADVADVEVERLRPASEA